MIFLYMIQNSIGKLYVGIAKDPKNRLNDHNNQRGAAFTKHISDFEIVFLESYDDFNKAREREIQIKKWRREKKEVLIKRYQQGLSTKISN